MFDFTKVREGVEDYLGEFVGDYRIDEIVDALYDADHDAQSLDDFDYDLVLDVVQRNEI